MNNSPVVQFSLNPVVQFSLNGVLAAFRAPTAGGFRGRGRGKGIGVMSGDLLAMAVSRIVAEDCTTGATVPPLGSEVERASAAVPSSVCTGGGSVCTGAGCNSGTAGPADQGRGSNTDCDPAAT